MHIHITFFFILRMKTLLKLELSYQISVFPPPLASVITIFIT